MGVHGAKGRSGEDPGKIQGRSIDLRGSVFRSVGRRIGRGTEGQGWRDKERG